MVEERYIPSEPRKSMLMDGFGNTVMVVRGIPSINKEQEEVVEFLVKVSEPVQAIYKFNEKTDLDSQRNMKLTVKKIDLINMNPFDDSNRRWFYVNSLKHEPTEFSKREEFFKIQLQVKDRIINALESENLRLAEENHLCKTNPEMMAARSAELSEKTLRGIAEILRPNKDESYGK